MRRNRNAPTAVASPTQDALWGGTAWESMEVGGRRTTGSRPPTHLRPPSRLQQAKLQQAEQAYQTAIQLNPAYTPAWVNLADYYRGRQDEAAAEKTLRQAIDAMPAVAELHYALGLSLVRQQRAAAAIEELQQAASLDPDSVRFIYVYAVALNSSREPDKALLVLQGAHTRFPNNTDILSALVAFNRDQGNSVAANRYAKKLQALSPPAGP